MGGGEHAARRAVDVLPDVLADGPLEPGRLLGQRLVETVQLPALVTRVGGCGCRWIGTRRPAAARRTGSKRTAERNSVVLFAAAGAAMTAAGHPWFAILLLGVAGIGVAAVTRVAAPGR
jgi:hypothetical protein